MTPQPPLWNFSENLSDSVPPSVLYTAYTSYTAFSTKTASEQKGFCAFGCKALWATEQNVARTGLDRFWLDTPLTVLTTRAPAVLTC